MDYHSIPEEGFFLNQVIDLLKVEPVQIERSEDYKQFELNLNEKRTLLVHLENFESECIDGLKVYLTEVKREIQLATEKEIQRKANKQIIDQINKSNEEFIDIIDNYEKKYIQEFKNKADSIKQTLNSELIQKFFK